MFIINNLVLCIPSFAVFLVLLIISRVWLISFFKTFIKTKVILTEQSIERISVKSHEKVLFENITKMYIKRTTAGSIRELKLSYIGGNTMVLNGLDNFEDLFKQLTSRGGNNKIAITKIREGIDYDHPAFYVIFGFLTSFVTVFAIKFSLYITPEQIQIANTCLTIFIFIMGCFFIFSNPLAKGYGEKARVTDYIWGGVMIICSIIAGYFVIYK
ncbi:MAG: hypothetical protein WC955_01635 [Elusimicrobiota bacterium]